MIMKLKEIRRNRRSRYKDSILSELDKDVVDYLRIKNLTLEHLKYEKRSASDINLVRMMEESSDKNE